MRRPSVRRAVRRAVRRGRGRPAVAGEGDATHHADLVVVAVGVVGGAAVVPDADVTDLPAVPDGVLRQGLVGEQQVEDAAALGVRDARDVRGEPRVDEQALATGLRVDAHDGVLDRGQLGDLLAVPHVADPPTPAQVGSTPLAVAVVHGGQPVGLVAHRCGERLVGQLAVHPARVTAVRRELYRAQDRAQRRLLHEGDVGVPDVGEGELRVVAVDVVDLRERGRLVARGDRVTSSDLAEAAAELDLVGVGEVLAPEEEHLEVDQRLAERLDVLVGACAGRAR